MKGIGIVMDVSVGFKASGKPMYSYERTIYKRLFMKDSSLKSEQSLIAFKDESDQWTCIVRFSMGAQQVQMGTSLPTQ